MSVNHQPAYFLKVLLVHWATFNLQSDLFSCFLWPIVPFCLVAFTHTSDTLNQWSHHAHPSSPTSLLFSIHPVSKISQQIPALSKREVAIPLGPCVVWTGCLRCFLSYSTTMLSERLTVVSEQGTSKPSTKWKLITVRFLWATFSQNCCTVLKEQNASIVSQCCLQAYNFSGFSP